MQGFEKISLPSWDLHKPSRIWSLWFRVWVTPCLVHLSDSSMLAEGQGRDQAGPVWPWHCCSAAPASAWARLTGLSVVLPGLVICSDHSKDSTHCGPEQVKGCHFQGRLWHRWGQGQAKARLRELPALQSGCSPPASPRAFRLWPLYVRALASRFWGNIMLSFLVSLADNEWDRLPVKN